MAETLFMRKVLNGLRPTDALGIEALARYSADEDVKVEITRPRNVRHHRKMYALLQAIYPHQVVYATFKQFEGAIKCATGFGETVPLPDGRVMLFPESWSFANLDQAGFDEVYNRVVDLILTRILPGIDREDVDREVADILRGRDPRPEPA